MTAPVRIQLSRAKGWRMPPNTVKVDRSTRWGNPFKVGDRAQLDPGGPIAVCFSAEEAVEAFRAVLSTETMVAFRAEVAAELRGKNLACWCPLDAPHCHADVLLEIANA